MTGLITEPIGNIAYPDQGSDFVPAGAWEGQDPFGLTRMVGRGLERAVATSDKTDADGNPIAGEEPMPAVEAQAKYGIPDHLIFANDIPESVASSMHDAKMDEITRQYAAARAPGGFWHGAARIGAGFAVGAIDPINLAAMFLPVVGEARMAGALARAGFDGLGSTTAARFASGAIGGGTAMLPLTALHYGLARQEQADYGAMDAMADIAMGTMLGGGLHTLIGGAGDLLGRAFGRSRTGRLVADDPQARETALRAAVSAVADGRGVEVAQMDLGGLQSGFAARLAARGGTAEGSYATYTPQGLRVELRPEVVEAGSLIASHGDDGVVNPAFPHEEGMQPRDRSSVAAQAQITEMASRLEPERLGPSPEASTGAPIVNADGVVESGNGRILALRRVYTDPRLADQAAAYRAYLQAQGHNVEGMSAPVLIGRRVTDLTPAQARDFTRGANERSTMGMSAAEQARADAGRAAAAIGDWHPGDLAGPRNAGFVRAFMAQMPSEERAGMLLADGRLSGEGERRIRAALLAHAYGDAIGPTLERMLNGDVEHMRGVAAALADVAGDWGRLRSAAARGDIPAGLDLTPAIGEAVQLLDRARRTGTPIAEQLAQSDIEGGPSPAALAVLRMLFSDEAMRRPVGRARLAELLHDYVDQAMEAKPGPNLFDDAETTAPEILRSVGGERAGAAADALEAADAATSHLADAAGEAKPAAVPDAPTEQLAQLEDFIARAREAGTLDADAEAELRRLTEDAARLKGWTDAVAQAGTCLLRAIG